MPELWIFIVSAIIIGLVIEAITEIIVASDFPVFLLLRNYFARLAIPEDDDFTKVKWYHTFLFKLLTCGYCCSVWVALGCSFFMPGSVFQFDFLNNILIKAFLLHRLSNWWHIALELFRRGRVHTLDIDFGIKRKDEDDAPRS